MKKLLTLLLLSFIAVFNQVNALPADFIVSVSNDNTVRKIDSNGNEVWVFTGFTDNLRAVIVDADGFIYAGGDNDTVKKIDSNGYEVWTFTGHTDRIYALAVDSNGNVFSASQDETIRKIDSTGTQVWSFTGFPTAAFGLAVDKFDNVYAAGQDFSVRKIDSTGTQVWSFTGHTFFVNSVAVDINGNVYTAASDNTVKKLDSSGNEIWTFTGHTNRVFGVAVNYDGTVYTASWDDTVKKIDSNGNEIWTFTGHGSNDVRDVQVDEDGNVYSGSRDGVVKKIDSNGNEVWSFTNHTNTINALALSQALPLNEPIPEFYNVELQTNTPYNDFIYIDDEVNVTTDSVITTILNDESFTVTNTAQSTGSFTFNYWYDLDNMQIFTTDRNFTIENPDQNYNLIADYTLDSFNTFNIDSNLPSPQDFKLNTITLEGQNFTINQTEFDNYQHPNDRSWEIIAPTNNIGFYEFDYYYDNNANDIYDFNHIITGSGFSPPNLTAVYSLPEEYQINLIIESGIGDIIFQHGENDPISGPFISQTIGLGDNWTATAPNNNGFQFRDWYDLENINVFSTSQTIDINNTVRDYYLEATYFTLVNINWDSNGGTPIPQQSVIINSSVQPPTEPVRPGFIFDYWKDSNNNEVSFPQTITEDVTFTAVWLETFTVDFQVNGGAPVPSQTVLENATINVVTPSRFGYTFEGWYTDNVTFNNEFDFNTPIDQNDTLFAKWAFGTEDNAEQSLNVFLVDSNLDDPFAQIIIVLAFFVLLNSIIYVYSGPMIVTLILNFILTALFMVLGFIPFWIIIMIFIAIFGFALLMLFGGRSAA